MYLSRSSTFVYGGCNTLRPRQSAAILQTFSNVCFVSKRLSCDYNFMEVYSGVPIDNNSALGRIMAWRPRGDKLLSNTMMTQFTDACVHQMALMS